MPDFDVLGKAYFDKPSPEELKKLNDYFMYSYVQDSLHRYFYSGALLKQAMEMSGFQRIEKMEVTHSSFVAVVDWQCGFVGVKP